MKAPKLKWHRNGGDICCKRERDGIYVCVSWMVSPWRYQVLRMKKVNGEWKSLEAGPSFPWSNAGRADAKKWATKWVLSVLPNTRPSATPENPL
jgi:hypothetical protein